MMYTNFNRISNNKIKKGKITNSVCSFHHPLRRMVNYIVIINISYKYYHGEKKQMTNKGSK